MRLLVTGGDGFIGSHLVEALLRQGGRVRVLDNLFARGGANLDYLQALGGHLEAVVDDIRSSEACRRACQGVDYVLHQAGLGSVPRSVEDPVESHEINATGTLKMLQAAKEAGVRRFVWASSSSVYGDQEPADGPKVETMLPHPASPYGAAKLMGEHYARLFHSLYGFPTVSLRYFNVFGPRQDPHSPYAAVVPKFIQALKAGQRPVVFGDGRQSRDFTYIANVVEANLKALTAAGAPGLVFNVAQGETYDLLDLLGRLQALLGTRIEPEFAPARPGDVRHSLADMTRSRAILGVELAYNFDQGLAETVAAYNF